MRLLVFCAFYPPHHAGGYELRCRDVLSRLAERGHEVVVMTTRCPKGCQEHTDQQIVLRVLHERKRGAFVPGQIDQDWMDVTAVRTIQADFRPDVVYLWHVQNLSNAIFSHFATQSIPLVLDDGGTTATYLHTVTRRGLYFWHNPSDSLIKRTLKRVVAWLAIVYSMGQIKTRWPWPEQMRVYFNGQSGKELALSQGTPVGSAAVIPSGLDLDIFTYQPRQALHTPLRFLLPSRIVREKGILDAVELARQLTARGLPVQLDILGEVQSSEYHQSVLAAVREAGLEECIRLLPIVSQDALAALYREADVCFFPTGFRSGRSRVPLEAMASGCLVITYGNEGSREIITDGKTGFVIPEGNIAAAVEIIERMRGNSPEYHRILQNARAEIEAKYSMDAYVDSVERFLLESLQAGQDHVQHPTRRQEDAA